MELPLILFHSTIAGLAAGTIALLFAPLFARAGALPPWRARTLWIESTAITVHALAGLALGLLFWLSWGLAAFVGVSWPQRGFCFGIVAWFALCLPVLLLQLLHTQIDRRFFIAHAVDAFVTCLMVGLACAWSWDAGRS